MASFRKVTVVNAVPPEEDSINSRIQWIALSLGFFSTRDKDKTCFRIFLELLRNSKKHIAVSSDDLSFRLKVSRGTVIHHLHKLQEAGIIESQENRYFLVSSSVKEMVEHLESQVSRSFEKIKKVSEELDENFDSLLGV
ncbi:MAG TPA: transcriptional regulator [Candidatus Woesearchaeota archaeon]|nr:transcriptional regulator [Candidatus Woesearchaeota archaeon]